MDDYLTKIIEKELSKETDEPRAYIGASSIGNQCLRAIWYGLHAPDKKVVTPKQRLTFAIGKLLEKMLLRILRQHLSLSVNYACKSGELALFQGHADAVILNDHGDPISLIEIKTAKDSSFNIFKKKGLRLWCPDYYDQVQSYMGMTGIHKCYFLVINKDTSETHDVLIKYDAQRYAELVAKAQMVAGAQSMPPRINGSPAFYKCKMCFYNEVCHDPTK